MPRKKQVKPAKQVTAVNGTEPVQRVDLTEKTEPTAKPADINQGMYDLYVQGIRINDIADKYGVESLEVMQTIQKIEANR